MNLPQIEKKWRERWDNTGLYKFSETSTQPTHYVLEMFSYPSGAKLHIGHWYNYSLADTYARFKRMQGYNVFHPMGFDAFGLPAENYAIKTGIHPKDSTMQNIETMERQLREMGASFDWNYELTTCSPDYYKWTQWCFLQLYKKGLAYRKAAPVNWCNDCGTVLANEQVVDGCCERCDTPVVRKHLTQWFFKITDYAERLLEGLEGLDWPERTKLMQKNWIGKSVGGEIKFELCGGGDFSVFTTRADTLFGCTYVVISPEHEMLDKIVTPEQKEAVEQYKAFAAAASEIDRLATTREKTGAFTGAYAINPINGRNVPVWTADYVLASYGTGIVMAVPAHDERDFEFAKKFSLPIERVVEPASDTESAELPYVGYGILVNSPGFDGVSSEEAKKGIIESLLKQKKGDFKVNYRLRDWLISRQRYWGAPIPMIHCEHCGTVPVPEEDLPVVLPYNVDFTPDGTSPLAKCEEFVNVKCPICGKDAKRDADTMDTFVCSSWYYLRYPHNKNTNVAWNKDSNLFPVDKYIGGAEHACMHLLYARFFAMAFHDMGLLSFDEPFKSLVHQGVILGPNGDRMSKSRGNVISPDSYVLKFGSDVFRMYLGFGFSYVEGGPWNDDGIKAIDKYLDRVERLVDKVLGMSTEMDTNVCEKCEAMITYILHNTIKCVTRDIEAFSFNTAIARLMELTNATYKYTDLENANRLIALDAVKDLLLLMAPFAPHFTEELWEKLGHEYSIFNHAFPIHDESALIREETEYPLQVNGKLRQKFTVPSDMSQDDLKEYVMANFAHVVEGKQIVKIIIVPGKIVNIVVK